jgi:hypothetical protein
MLKILNEHYYLDLDAIEKYTTATPPQDYTGSAENHISVVKYDMVKLLTDVLLTESEEVDETLGIKGSNSLSIPFKIAFNSLLNKKLLNKY